MRWEDFLWDVTKEAAVHCTLFPRLGQDVMLTHSRAWLVFCFLARIARQAWFLGGHAFCLRLSSSLVGVCVCTHRRLAGQRPSFFFFFHHRLCDWPGSAGQPEDCEIPDLHFFCVHLEPGRLRPWCFQMAGELRHRRQQSKVVNYVDKETSSGTQISSRR